MALHKPKQLYVLGKLRFSSIKPMKMIEITSKMVGENCSILPVLDDAAKFTIFLKLLRVM
jgi:hypothetical protein